MNKKFVIIAIVIILTANGSSEAFALIVSHTPEELYEIYDIIVFGEIIDYTDFGSNSHYDVQVIQYLKNPQTDKLIQVIGSGVHHGGIWVEDQTVFEIGERAVMYLDNDENQLKIAPYSFSTQMDVVNPYWYYPFRWVAVAALAIGVAGFLVWRKRK